MITAFINDLVFGVAQVLGQAQAKAPKAFEAADAGADTGDEFRKAVWIAYGLVLLLLAAYSVFLMLRSRAVTRRLEHLAERFELSRGRESAAGTGAASDGGD